MSLIVNAKSGTSLPILEAGVYPALCYGLIDLGEQYSETYKKSQPKVLIMWELPGETFTDGEGRTQSRVISQSYTMSLNEKATLRRDLDSWRGRAFREDELKAFDLRNILGAPCLLNIIHNERNGKTFANVSTIMRLPKGTEKPTGRLEQIAFDLDTDDLSILDKLPEWIVERVKQSETYKDRIAGKGDTASDGGNADSVDFVDMLSDTEEDMAF